MTEIPEELRFDMTALDVYDPVQIQRFADEQPELYLNHLKIAARLADMAELYRHNPDDGHRIAASALEQIVAMLRSGQFL